MTRGIGEMTETFAGRACGRILLALALVALVLPVAACAQNAADPGGAASTAPAEKSAPDPATKADEPAYHSWTVHINDDDSYSAGGMTYKIALNFDATNPSGDPAGTYKGTATASTSTQGNVGGAHLSAQAIAQSGNLSFALDDPSGGGALASLDGKDLPDLSGSGTITMKAAGSGSIGGAGGSFSNTSSQKITVKTTGDKATLTVTISGHTYTFNGTISGRK
jgi:hypothetical protein